MGCKANQNSPEPFAILSAGFKKGFDGAVDENFIEALKQFQRENGIAADGLVGAGSVTERILNARIERQNPGEWYVWRTAGDEKVRDTHRMLEGRRFQWGNPPAETKGKHPGEDYNCRCTAEPLFPKPGRKPKPPKDMPEPEGLTQVVTSSMAQSSKKWDDLEFFIHFLLGNGLSVSLSEIGHLKGVVNKAEEIMFANVEEQVAEKMREVLYGPLIYSTEKGYYKLAEVHWILGGTELFFTDLMLGRAYGISGFWEAEISGSIKVTE